MHQSHQSDSHRQANPRPGRTCKVMSAAWNMQCNAHGQWTRHQLQINGWCAASGKLTRSSYPSLCIGLVKQDEGEEVKSLR